MSHSSDYWMDEMKFLEAEITKKEDEINAQLLRQNIIKANVERNEMTGEVTQLIWENVIAISAQRNQFLESTNQKEESRNQSI